MASAFRDDSTFMTIPDEMTDDRFVAATGNDFVSLPEIDAWGRIAGVTFLHAGCAGLIEVRGSRPGRAEEGGPPFIAPVFNWRGSAVELVRTTPRFVLEDDWLPSFTWTGGEEAGAASPAWTLIARIIAPPGEKGFCYLFELQRGVSGGPGGGRGGEGPEAAELGIQLFWGYTGLRVFTSRALPLTRSCRYDRWTHGVVAEALGPLPVFAFALNASGDFDRLRMDPPGEAGENAEGREPAAKAEGFPEPAGSGRAPGLSIRAAKSFSLAAGGRAVAAFYLAFNREADGARTTGVHLRRLGWRALESGTRRWLAGRRIRVPGRPREEAALNRNLLFCRFFATGLTLDTEEVVAVTSRSPRYYVSAAFWARDALLWALPGLILADRARAREVLLYAFSICARHPGDHAQYLDGRRLYPGFELDEAAAFLVGLGGYLEATADCTLIRDPRVQEGMDRVLAEIERWTARAGDGKPLLCRTFLDPSDDPVGLPFLTYDNVLAGKAWRAAAEVFTRLADEADGEGDGRRASALRERALGLREAAEALAEAVARYCVVEGPFGPMYAWAVDLAPAGPGGEGEGPKAGGTPGPASSHRGWRRIGAELYDDPPGSLELIGCYNGCRNEGEAAILANTRRWIHSRHNPYFVEGPFGAPGSAHSPRPWPLALANVILAEAAEYERAGKCDSARLERAVHLLSSAPMDCGLACESMDPETGAAKTGAAFAGAAGFLAWSLRRGLALLEREDGRTRFSGTTNAGEKRRIL